jgi:hypothetical protein
MKTKSYTVETLITMWQEGEIGVEDGEIEPADELTIEVIFQGSDGKLYLTYDLQDDLAGRSDTDQPGRFNIFDY